LHSLQVPLSAKPCSFHVIGQLYDPERELLPSPPSYFKDYLFITIQLPNVMFQANVIPLAFEDEGVFCGRPERGSALQKKRQQDVLLSWLVPLL